MRHTSVLFSIKAFYEIHPAEIYQYPLVNFLPLTEFKIIYSIMQVFFLYNTEIRMILRIKACLQRRFYVLVHHPVLAHFGLGKQKFFKLIFAVELEQMLVFQLGGPFLIDVKFS